MQRYTRRSDHRLASDFLESECHIHDRRLGLSQASLHWIIEHGTSSCLLPPMLRTDNRARTFDREVLAACWS